MGRTLLIFLTDSISSTPASLLWAFQKLWNITKTKTIHKIPSASRGKKGREKKEINEKWWNYFGITISSSYWVQIFNFKHGFTFTCYYCHYYCYSLFQNHHLSLFRHNYLCYRHAETKMFTECRFHNVPCIELWKTSRETSMIVGLVYSTKIAYLQTKLTSFLDIIKIFTILHTTTI